MSVSSDEDLPKSRRPYQRPMIADEDVFEREALATCDKVGEDCFDAFANVAQS